MLTIDPHAMSEDRTDARWNGASTPPTQYRLVWRWMASGTTGRGPWMHREEVVEAWMETLNERFAGNVEHWVERSTGTE